VSKENIYSIATASILDQATIRQALTWSIADHVARAKSTGYNGVELWPQGRKPLSQIKSGELSQAERNGITSTHQTVAKDLADAIRTFSLPDIEVSLMMAERFKSLDYLEKIRLLVDRDIPVVLFSSAPKDFLETTKYREKGVQTDPALCAEIGATNAEEFVEAVLEMGFTNVVIDTHHLRRPNIETGGENPLSDWQKSVPVLLPYTNEIHVGLGRIDYGGVPRTEIDAELWDFMNDGRRNTNVVRLLRSIAGTGWNGLVVLETRPSAIKDVFEQRGFELSERNLLDSFERIRNTLYQIFGN